MTIRTVREQLYQQLNELPDDLVEQIAEFAAFLAARREAASDYVDWDRHQWEDFALNQFFREGDEVTYSLQDAQEIYHE